VLGPFREETCAVEVEVEIGPGGRLQRWERFELLGEAQLEAERARHEGGVPRVVRVADDGTRGVTGWISRMGQDGR
jgi:hypothetical protein